jgi:hypothetical protein
VTASDTAAPAVVCDDAWNAAQRAEEPLQRADRNFAELLQELRVVLVGVQILFGFLLTLSFSARFDDLDDVQHVIYVVTLAFAALSSTLLVGPVAAHRVLFQRGRKRELVRAGHRMALAGLAFLALTLASSLLLVLDIAVGRWGAVLLTAGLLVTTAVLWLGIPLRMRR